MSAINISHSRDEHLVIDIKIISNNIEKQCRTLENIEENNKTSENLNMQRLHRRQHEKQMQAMKGANIGFKVKVPLPKYMGDVVPN